MNADVMATVLELACQVSDRDSVEQRMMLDLALHLDAERGSFAASNHHLHEPELVDLVEASYDPSAGRRVTLTTAQRGRYDRLRASWRRCDACTHPMGAHYKNDVCPSTPYDIAWLALHGL